MLGTRVLKGTKWLSVPVSGGTGLQWPSPSWRRGRGATGKGLGRSPTPPPPEVSARAATSKKARELERAAGALPALAWP